MLTLKISFHAMKKTKENLTPKYIIHKMYYHFETVLTKNMIKNIPSMSIFTMQLWQRVKIKVMIYIGIKKIPTKNTYKIWYLDKIWIWIKGVEFQEHFVN